jgi:hypothetical protein
VTDYDVDTSLHDEPTGRHPQDALRDVLTEMNRNDLEEITRLELGGQAEGFLPPQAGSDLLMATTP